jgi:CubicO group peptidase (beta-lactamase class C family)
MHQIRRRFAASCSTQEKSSQTKMKMDVRQIEDLIKNQTEPEPFSGVVLLHALEDDAVLFEQGYGFAIRSESIPNRVDTRFQTASGSKIFTSVAVCRLIQEGLLRLDTRLADCVDVTFPQYDPNITVRHLLTHRSGITSYFEEDVDDDYAAL